MSEAFSNQCRIIRFGRVPSDFRPVAPDRMICTKVRSILPLSTTRSNARPKCGVCSIDNQASKSAGASFMKPR